MDTNKIIEEFKRRRSLMNYSQIWKIHPMGVAEDIDEFFELSLHKIKDEAKREAIEKINGMKKNKGSTESISDAVFLGYNQALDDVLNSLKEDGGEDKTKWK